MASTSDLTEHQLRILTLLDEEDPTMVGEIAEFTGVTASTMSLNLKRLEERGFVKRSRDPVDRRVMNVRLTDRGRVAKEASSRVEPERVDRLLGMLRPEARRRVVSGLALLAGAADRLAAQGDEHVEALTGTGLAPGAGDPGATT